MGGGSAARHSEGRRDVLKGDRKTLTRKKAREACRVGYKQAVLPGSEWGSEGTGRGRSARGRQRLEDICSRQQKTKVRHI